MAVIRSVILEGPDSERHLRWRLMPPDTWRGIGQCWGNLDELHLAEAEAAAAESAALLEEYRRQRMDEALATLIGVVLVAMILAGFLAFMVSRFTMDDDLRQRVKMAKVHACQELKVPSEKSLCLIGIK